MEDPGNEQKVAEAHRNAIEPLWTEPLIEQIGARLPLADRGTQLVAEVRCGLIPIRLRRRLDSEIRMIALDPKRAMLDEARTRGEDEETEQIFFVPERVDAISYADGVFDASICCEGILTARQAEEGLGELARVTVPGGRVAIAAPLGSSFQVFYDMLDEAMRAHGMTDRLDRVDKLRETFLSPVRMTAIADELGLGVEQVTQLEWTISFERGWEFLHSPLIRETFFPHWIGAVSSPKRDRVMRYMEDAIDTYWRGRTVETNVTAGFLTATVPEDCEK
jgi:SAM-dependent methyltransferase